jgi:hypothetical protein
MNCMDLVCFLKFILKVGYHYIRMKEGNEWKTTFKPSQCFLDLQICLVLLWDWWNIYYMHSLECS